MQEWLDVWNGERDETTRLYAPLNTAPPLLQEAYICGKFSYFITIKICHENTCQVLTVCLLFKL